jgi:hypothetical protein
MDEIDGRSNDRGLTGRIARWFLLTGNRLSVSFVFLLGIGAAFVATVALDVATVTSPNRVMWYLNGTVNGLLTLVPITVGVNQIVLSHELGSIQDLYDRRTDITNFRERVEERTGVSVSSPHASAFFSALLASVSDTAGSLQRRAERHTAGDRTSAEIGTVAESVAAEADRVNDEITPNETDMLRTFLALLTYDNSRQFYEIRRLQSETSDRGGPTAERLQELHELLVEIDAARQFLKTVVVERQLARLSRLLVYTGVPAVTVAAIGIFSYRDVAGLTLPHVFLVGVAGTMIVATLVPFAVLAAYVLRVATIALRTAAFGPFVPESRE